MRVEIEILEARLNKLEEYVKLIVDGTILENYTNDLKKVLNYEYSKLLNKLKEDMKKYNVKQQLNVKKLLLSKLPDKPMGIEAYLTKVKDFLKANNLEYNITKYESMIYSMGLVKDGQVCKKNIKPETLRIILEVL